MIQAISKGANIKLSEHFNSKEFDCQCKLDTCTFTLYSPQLFHSLERLRIACGHRPFAISSGFRCTPHNEKIGGVVKSQHMLGFAADIATPGSMDIHEFKYRALQIGFSMVLEYPEKRFVHMDIRDGLFT